MINPNSGTDNKRNIEKLIEQQLDASRFDYEITHTKGPRHATQLSKEAASLGYEFVLAVGGDGTVNEVGKGLIGSETAMGIIPSGSGNGLARHLQIPAETSKAIAIINQYYRTTIDTVKINDDTFIGVAGIGFDAFIAREFAQSKRRGFWSYVALVLRHYPKYCPQEIEMEVDGKVMRKSGLLMTFAKSSQYGNEIKIAPHAKLNDGYLHLVILKKPPFYCLPDILLKLRNGGIVSSKYCESIRCREIKIPRRQLSAHVDGEPVIFNEGIDLKVNPRSLKIVAPPTSSALQV
ncbi:MAG: diacylglycerol kinase family lipid kinase [Chlamydiia bacterium]|nr:diacylglycerol kinase family lipid kinase [Chlamydiia bacterium]